ncbi:type IV secretion system protein [Candidatus Saccharibacteria bacterium]|nr:type IV secretion system protein [Candidatus Saccharibacteria bacterium]
MAHADETAEEIGRRIETSLGQMKEAATVDLLFAAFDYCMSVRGQVNDYKANSGDISKFPLNGTTIYDSFLEVLLKGGGLAGLNQEGTGLPPAAHDNNEVKCNRDNNKLIELLANYVGGANNIFCDYRDNNRSGVSARYESHFNVWTLTTSYSKLDYGCNDYHDQNRYFNGNNGSWSRTYLIDLYRSYQARNPYAQLAPSSGYGTMLVDRWREGYTDNGMLYYYLLYNFKSFCGQETVTAEQASQDYLQGKVYNIKQPENDGNNNIILADQYYRVFREQETGRRYGNISLAMGGSGGYQVYCDTIVVATNIQAANIQKWINQEMIDYKIADCRSQFATQKAILTGVVAAYRALHAVSSAYYQQALIISDVVRGGRAAENELTQASEILQLLPEALTSISGAEGTMAGNFRQDFTTQNTVLNTIQTDLTNLSANPQGFERFREELENRLNILQTNNTNMQTSINTLSEKSTRVNGLITSTRGPSSTHLYNYNDDYSNFQCNGVSDLDGYTPPDFGLDGIDNILDVDPGVTASDPSCFDGGGALGWILCPVLMGLGDMAGKLYEEVLTPFLRVDARLFNSDPSNGTFQAWTVFQTFANIIFIILLLVVIFSQLTGIGIDNYGIKKILPKLIITAILINLSYFICQLAVDISNIIGFGIKQVFEGIRVSPATAGGDYAGALDPGVNVVTVLIIILLTGAGIALVAHAGLAVLLPLILGLLSAAIAIFFVFVLLGARQAGVVILTVIAPLAIVCYMLPNTKKLFDRWLKIFQGLLLLFPLCGLLIGGASLASRILLATNANDFWMGLIALLLGVIPLFFLPTLLKASFAAMGNMGAKISGIGKSLTGRATGQVRGSNWYKNKQMAGRAQGARWTSATADKLAGSKLGKSKFGQSKFGRAMLLNSNSAQRSRSQAMDTYDSQNTKTYSDNFAKMGAGEDVEAGLTRALKSNDANMMDAAIGDLAARGDFDKITRALGSVDPSKLSARMRDRLSNSLITQKKEAAHLWGWSKQMKSGNNMSLASYANDVNPDTGKTLMRQDLEKENDDLIATQDKTSLEAINSLMPRGADGKASYESGQMPFSEKQMRNAVSGIGKEASLNQFNQMLTGMHDKGQSVIESMNAAQVAKLSADTMNSIGEQNLKSWVSPEAIAGLKDAQNASIVAAMSPKVRDALLGPGGAPAVQQTTTIQSEGPTLNVQQPPTPPPAAPPAQANPPQSRIQVADNADLNRFLNDNPEIRRKFGQQ